jgi:EAL domain-containing protein (putative c-di-GMP-specific phosphodiesterase class I)
LGIKVVAEGVETKVAINVSKAQLLSDDFLPALNTARLCANVDAKAIELELTESLIMDLSPRIQNLLGNLRESGFNLAIDDFGTGYSSLAVLRDLPVSKIKFDRSFIQTLPGDERAQVVVTSLCAMAKALGIKVVAEGVETFAQQASCEAANVDAVQGFLHARPMAEEEVLAWLKSRSYEMVSKHSPLMNPGKQAKQEPLAAETHKRAPPAFADSRPTGFPDTVPMSRDRKKGAP